MPLSDCMLSPSAVVFLSIAARYENLLTSYGVRFAAEVKRICAASACARIVIFAAARARVCGSAAFVVLNVGGAG